MSYFKRHSIAVHKFNILSHKSPSGPLFQTGAMGVIPVTINHQGEVRSKHSRQIVVLTIAEHVCNCVLKRIFKPSTYRLQAFLVKNQYLESLQQYEDKAIPE